MANILQEMDDAKEYQDEVSRAIAENLTAADDEAVEAELAALEAAERSGEGKTAIDTVAAEAAAEKERAAAAAAAAESAERERLAAAAAVAAAMPKVPDALAVPPPELPDAPLGSGVDAGAGAGEEGKEEDESKTLVPA